jgi:hypothetical protein
LQQLAAPSADRSSSRQQTAAARNRTIPITAPEQQRSTRKPQSKNRIAAQQRQTSSRCNRTVAGARNKTRKTS